MIPTYLNILAQSYPFCKILFQKSKSIFKSLVEMFLTGNKISEDVLKLAIRLVSAPASSASIEWLFSKLVIRKCSQQSSEQILI